jgi:fatty-acid desaturase
MYNSIKLVELQQVSIHEAAAMVQKLIQRRAKMWIDVFVIFSSIAVVIGKIACYCMNAWQTYYYSGVPPLLVYHCDWLIN